MSKTVEFSGMGSGIMQCRGPQPENPATKGLEVFVGLSINPRTNSRTVTCDFITLDDNNIPRCSVLNHLGTPALPEDPSRAAVMTLFSPNVEIAKTEVNLELSSAPAVLNQEPREYNPSNLPVCRLIDLVVI